MEAVTALTLTWPTAFAVVASIVTITAGLIGFLLKIQGKKTDPITAASLQQLHARISDIKDRAAKIESDVQVLVHKHETLDKEVDEHEERDQARFNHVDQKIDKITDILMKILTDDKL